MNDTLPLPSPGLLPGSKTVAPFVLVGDKAFPLKSNLLKLYSRRSLWGGHILELVYNYRLSCTHMSVECAFGIMAQRFRCLTRRMVCSVDTAEAVVKAVYILHNFLLKQDDLVQEIQYDLYALRKKPSYTGQFKPFHPLRGYHSSMNVRDVCNLFTTYFMSTLGEVPWQYCCTHVAIPEGN